MIDSYISDMTDYIAPENETAMMRVDRNDIWWNYKQIEGEATSFDWIVQDTGSTLATYKRLFIPNPFSSDEENEAKKSAQQQEEDAESARRQRNYEKLQGFRDQLDTSIRKELSDSVDEIKKIYENKVIPFENTDDSYKSKMSAYYSEWSSIGDKFSDAGNAIRDFLAGIGDSLVDTVKGLLTLVVDLGILYVDVRWKSIVPIQVPEVLDQEVEKIKQKYEPLLKDPVNTIGEIGQSICDTADEKGVAYSSGYIVTEVVTALLADKGLDKLKNVAKTGKTADNVADIAEGAGKAAENAAEDAAKAGKELEGAAKGAESAAEDAGKAGKTAGKVGESGINSYADFSKAISDIGMRSDLTDAQKISELQNLFESSNYKADINVPSDIQYVKGFDAKGNVIYDWPPKLGFDESTIQSISRTDSLPDTWDRYGYMGGSNFADVPPTGKYTYSERAIPYVENEAAYHTGTFNNATYFDKIDAIKNGDIDGLNTILSKEGIANVDSSYFKNLQNTYNDFIEDTADAVGRNIDATYGLKGTAASWGDMSGGAGQYVTPLNGSTMKRLGIIN